MEENSPEETNPATSTEESTELEEITVAADDNVTAPKEIPSEEVREALEAESQAKKEPLKTIDKKARKAMRRYVVLFSILLPPVGVALQILYMSKYIEFDKTDKSRVTYTTYGVIALIASIPLTILGFLPGLGVALIFMYLLYNYEVEAEYCSFTDCILFPIHIACLLAIILSLALIFACFCCFGCVVLLITCLGACGVDTEKLLRKICDAVDRCLPQKFKRRLIRAWERVGFCNDLCVNRAEFE